MISVTCRADTIESPYIFKSDYVPAADVDELRAKIERRRALAAAIREQKRSQKQIIRALGRVPDVD